MIKVYCDTCRGVGLVGTQNYCTECDIEIFDGECPDCKGKGYTEVNMKSPEEIKAHINETTEELEEEQLFEDGAAMSAEINILEWVLGIE